MAGNFIPMVYAVLKDKGVDTKNMSAEQAVEKYNEIVGKSGNYNVATGNKASKSEKSKRQSNEDNLETKSGPDLDEDKKAALQKLVNTLKKVKTIKIKELAEMIKNFQPVELYTDSKAILSEFDKHTAQKTFTTEEIRHIKVICLR